MPDISARIAAVRQRIAAAARAVGRDPDAIGLLAVSKTHPPASIRLAAAQGIRCIGENYLQEALKKQAALTDLALEWHFIGPIQSNKTGSLARHFDWVHSVDRVKVARRLDAQRPGDLPPLNICLQVNISAEEGKAGATPGELAALAEVCAGLPRLRLRGVMAIPAVTSDPRAQRAAFADVRAAFEALQRNHPGLDTLSMGMSADLEAAVAEGATLVRVGTDIFGARRGP